LKVAIIGAGAMGSLFGGSLASVVDEVCLYSTNKAYVEAVNKNGLIMTQGEKKNIVRARATSDPKEIGNLTLLSFMSNIQARAKQLKMP
jgi:2-dehydropantoate 2-reductase